MHIVSFLFCLIYFINNNYMQTRTKQTPSLLKILQSRNITSTNRDSILVTELLLLCYCKLRLPKNVLAVRERFPVIWEPDRTNWTVRVKLHVNMNKTRTQRSSWKDNIGHELFTHPTQILLMLLTYLFNAILIFSKGMEGTLHNDHSTVREEFTNPSE